MATGRACNSAAYNTVRPRQALGYLTPAEFLGRWRIEHPGPEV